MPVVLVAGRGMRQLVTGFDDQAAAARWLHDRGPMASGPLTPPEVPSLRRALLEEHILARMLYRPGDLPGAMAALPATTFTADVRYDIYAAIITVARSGQPWDLRHVAAELGRRMDWVLDWALPRYGGQDAPWAQAYLRRLTDTEPVSYAEPRLLADDTRPQLRSEGPEAGVQRPAGTVRRRWEMPGNDRRPEHTPDDTPEIWRPPPEPRPGPESPAPRI